MNERVPEGWQTVRVKDIFSLNTKSIVPNNFPREKFAYFSLPAFDEFDSSVVVCGDKIESNKFSIDVDSILISKLNPRKPRVMLAKPKGLRACASTEFISYVAKKSEDVSLSYFKHFFFSDIFHGRLQLAATGSTNSHVRVLPSETISWKIIIPPLPEQKKIASILTSVDAVIKNTRAQINKLRDLKKALMQDLLTKGIGHTKFKNSELGQIPKSWEVKKLIELSLNGITNGVFNDPRKVGIGYKLINVYDMYQKFGFDVEKLKRLSLDRNRFDNNKVDYGDVFFTRSSLKLEGIAHCNICLSHSSDITYDGHLMKIKPNIDKVDPIFLALHGISDYSRCFFMKMAKQSTMTTIGQKDIAPLPVPVPPREEQHTIVFILMKMDSRISAIKLKLQKFQSLKKSLMQDLLTGKVRVKVN